MQDFIYLIILDMIRLEIPIQLIMRKYFTTKENKPLKWDPSRLF